MLVTHVDGDLVALRWSTPGVPLLVFSTRRGGASPPPYDTLNLGRSTDDDPARVDHNRRRLLAALGRDPEGLVTAGQVHGADVRRATAGGHQTSCDALVTTRPHLTLAVSAADCAPVLLWTTGAVAAAHSGWRGAAAGVVPAAAQAVSRAAGVDLSEVHALIGPCIRPCCYPVGREVAARFEASCLRQTPDDVRLDLARAIALSLERAGVGEVLDVGRCTGCEPDWFFSHRRDQGRTGRQWGVAAMDASR